MSLLRDDGNSNIFAMDLRSRNTTRLTNESAIDTPTQLRTDGTQSLYGIFGNSESDIYVVGARVSGDAIILHGTP